ncbi:rhomboid family intramembrane serine protease [Aquisalimonas lutea]|uniref:rhomboid family intramembrane serine protease n=1 Tax=Aquisalimonas lutea TaxID=1327750 RepID=UPI0025B597E5|nr:rhomboid family intramembrane serine protease [Aquisalimonas lutea]MDN3516789.1 rhomboid family intramembrane serine protease [Aquisalimonas lutea]
MQGGFGSWLTVMFALWPLGSPDTVMTTMGMERVPPFQVWQLLTYGFLHGGTLHLLVNMFALWMFGVALENLWGSRRFAVYFLVCVVGAGLIQLVVATGAAAEGNVYPTVGASGGVFGILLGFGMMFPNERIMLLIPPIPMKAKYFVVAYGAFELWAGMTGTLAGVAHFAHLGGMVFGLLLILYWRHTGAFRRRPPGPL